MSKQGRFIVSSSIGGIVGMAIALALPWYVWWLGPLVGGLVGGVIYAAPDIIRYSPLAARTAWRGLTHTPKVAKIAGKVILVILKLVVKIPLFLLGLWPKMSKGQRMVAAMAWLAVIFFGASVYFTARYITSPTMSMVSIFGVLMPYMVYAVFLISRAAVKPYRDGGPKMTDAEMLARRKRTLFYVTPFGIAFFITTKVVPLLAMLLWEFGKFLGKFTKTLFFLVHSKEMVLVTIDTALGVTATYLLFVRNHEPILGNGPTLVLSAFISVLLSYFLNYQIVSRRILHLNGKKA